MRRGRSVLECLKPRESGQGKSALTAKAKAQHVNGEQGAGGMAQANPEADAIETAYEDHIAILYKNLVSCLMDSDTEPSPGGEQQCIQHFTTGLNLARRAKELALNICSATAATKVPLPSPAGSEGCFEQREADQLMLRTPNFAKSSQARAKKAKELTWRLWR
jgi:hypothetical protein